MQIVKKKPREDVDVAKIYESLVVNEEEPANLCRARFTVPVLCWLWCNYVDVMLIVLKYYGGTLAWRVSQLLYKFCCQIITILKPEISRYLLGENARENFRWSFFVRTFVCALISYADICTFDHNKSHTIWHY